MSAGCCAADRAPGGPAESLLVSCPMNTNLDGFSTEEADKCPDYWKETRTASTLVRIGFGIIDYQRMQYYSDMGNEKLMYFEKLFATSGGTIDLYIRE